MASIENRSRFRVGVSRKPELTRTFPFSKTKAAAAYAQALKAQGLKPFADRTNDRYAVRSRPTAGKAQLLFFRTEREAVDAAQQIEREHRQGIFVDYTEGMRTTLADLLTRYLKEESPRHKGFIIEYYTINALLRSAGCPTFDIREIYEAHPNPNPHIDSTKFRQRTGRAVRDPSVMPSFLLKPFARLHPKDIEDYIDERCQCVESSSVDRELDVISATCHVAIDTWRIAVPKNPIDGVRRPRYFNERDRRLKSGEEERLLAAARDDDARRGIGLRLEALLRPVREQAARAPTTYERKRIVREAKETLVEEARRSYVHVPLMEAFVEFQLDTGARRAEALGALWKHVDLEDRNIYIPESKNSRPRRLLLRKELIERLKELPRVGGRVFELSVEEVRSAWERICDAAGCAEPDTELRIHDLRHEAISRVAEAGSNLPGGFSLADLQAFSGHRDHRMLLRYTHLCSKALALRLDAAFEKSSNVHRGRRRLQADAGLKMADIVDHLSPDCPIVAPHPSATAAAHASGVEHQANATPAATTTTHPDGDAVTITVTVRKPPAESFPMPQAGDIARAVAEALAGHTTP
jgi:integrase